MNFSSIMRLPSKRILLGCGLAFLQLCWARFAHSPAFPYFEIFLAICTVALCTEAVSKTLSDQRKVRLRDFIFALAIFVLAACLCGLEKYLASVLIWVVAISLQVRIVDYFYLLAQRRQALDSRQCFLVLVVQFIVFFLLLGDTNWYISNNLQYGTPATVPHIHLGSLGWLAFFFLAPAVLASYVTRQSHAPSFWQNLQRDGDKDFLVLFYVLLALLTAILFLLNAEMLRPHWGQLTLLGDETGYVEYARSFAGLHYYMPSQPPLYTATLGILIVLFGDHPETALILNAVLLAGTLLLLVYAAQALTKNLFFGVLAAILFVANRGTYLFTWTALTEPMNAFTVTAVMAAAIYLIQNRSLFAYTAFGVAAVSAIMLRSQNNLFVLILAGFTFWYIYRQPGATPTRRELMVFLALLLLPQIGWGAYRYFLTGEFALTDTRGLKMLFGFNAPGTSQGLDSTTWAPSVNAWRASHPHATNFDMLLDAIRFRFQNPAETVSFLYWRTAELFNFRFIRDFGVVKNLQMNAQLIILYGLFFLTLLRKPSRTHIVACMLWLGFYASFIIIYSESRYRYPGDVIICLAVVRLLSEIFIVTPAPLAAPVRVPYFAIFFKKPFYVAILAATLLVCAPYVSRAERRIPIIPSRAMLPRTEKLSVAGVTPIDLRKMQNARPKDLAGKMVTVPLIFSGTRYRVASDAAAEENKTPSGNFNYASLTALELMFKTPDEMKVSKIALDTQSVYWGPPIEANAPYEARVLLLDKAVTQGPEGPVLIGYLLDLAPKKAN